MFSKVSFHDFFFFTLQHPHIWFIPAMKKYYFSPDCRIQDGAVLVIHYGEQQAVLPAGEVFVICQRWRLVVHVQCIYIYEISWLFEEFWKLFKLKLTINYFFPVLGSVVFLAEKMILEFPQKMTEKISKLVLLWNLSPRIFFNHRYSGQCLF